MDKEYDLFDDELGDGSCDAYGYDKQAESEAKKAAFKKFSEVEKEIKEKNQK